MGDASPTVRKWSAARRAAMRTAKAQIEQRVEFDPNGGCWLWSGRVTHSKSGYGKVYIDGRDQRAHRVSFEAFRGPVGDEWVLHKCDVRLCVNPEHLYLGDHADNTADLVARNRACREGAPKGEANTGAKLTEDLVREIRASTESSRQLAQRLHVTDSLIRRIRRGAAWSHVR